jgi:cation transport regulator ChaB
MFLWGDTLPKGQWTPPDAGKDAPSEVKDILARAYSDFRDEHPAEDPEVKAQGAQIAWGAVKNAGWQKDSDGKWMKKSSPESADIFDSPIAHFRLIEGGKPDSAGMLIEVHIIAPVWGSSGYYSEAVLREACRKRVYPEGMHMHLDHPTREAAKSQPARTLAGESPLAAIFTEDGHYEEKGWDGPGVYTIARVLPKYVEDIRAMAGHIGISHYVDGIAEEGTAPDGKKGPIIKELRASSLNTVDFVTVPGAEGHYRTMFGEMKVRPDPNPNKTKKRENMGENIQESLTLSEVRSKYPEVVTELKEQLKAEMKTEETTKDQSAKLSEAATKIRALEADVEDMATLAADCKAAGYIKEEMAKAKFPPAIAEALSKTLIKQVPLGEDHKIDSPKFAVIVTEAIKAKKDEIAAILKEHGAGLHDNGTGAFPSGDEGHKALVESFEANYLSQGKTKDEAHRLAEIAAGGR